MCQKVQGSPPVVTLVAATAPTCAFRRSFSSSAARLEKVMVMICCGCTPPAVSRCATRDISTRVLPLPGPATTLQAEWLQAETSIACTDAWRQ